ncbi:MAG: metal ABC transporter substrate-binding protein [Chloroflexota bacterium]
MLAALLMAFLISTSSCQPATNTSKPSIVVTYSVLGSIVNELVGDEAAVTVSVPNGLDPHEWEPSARDIEAINKANLVVENGLGLEAGLEKTLEVARSRGVKFFTASDYIRVRYVGPGEGIPSGGLDQVIGAPDPHFWTDPVTMKSVVSALVSALKQELNLDVAIRATDLENRLDAFNGEIGSIIAQVPKEDRKLVTGHESMGYFARRYDFQLIGVVIPSLSSQAGVSAADIAALKKAIQDNQVKAIFAELGTSPAVAKQIGSETGVKVVELTTHALPADGSYFTFMRNMATIITDALK